MATASTHISWTNNPAAQSAPALAWIGGVEAFKPARLAVSTDARRAGTARMAGPGNVQALAERCAP
jgi:hypothetical protein